MRNPFFFGAVALLSFSIQVAAQELPPGVTPQDLANNNKLFIDLATKALHWDDPTDPIKIVGPLYFVGTEASAPGSSSLRREIFF